MVPTSSQLAGALIESVIEQPHLAEKKVAALISFLNEFHLMHLLPQVCRVIAYRSDIESRARGCSITTAQVLDESSRDQLVKALKITTNDHIHMVVDESLIGGALIAHQGVMYDASLRTSLERLRFILKN